MNLSKKIFFVTMLAATTGLPIFAQNVLTSDTVVAIVEGKKIKLGHMKTMLLKLSKKNPLKMIFFHIIL